MIRKIEITNDFHNYQCIFLVQIIWLHFVLYHTCSTKSRGLKVVVEAGLNNSAVYLCSWFMQLSSILTFIQIRDQHAWVQTHKQLYASLLSRAMNSHQNSYISILLWQPVQLLTHKLTQTDTVWPFFIPLHFTFYPWMQQAATHQAKLAWPPDNRMIRYIKEEAGTKKDLQSQGWGSAVSQCSCLCEVRYERALIVSTAESETHKAYIIEEHIVKEEVALKHEITSALTSHSPEESISWSGYNKRGGACSYSSTLLWE